MYGGKRMEYNAYENYEGNLVALRDIKEGETICILLKGINASHDIRFGPTLLKKGMGEPLIYKMVYGGKR